MGHVRYVHGLKVSFQLLFTFVEVWYANEPRQAYFQPSRRDQVCGEAHAASGTVQRMHGPVSFRHKKNSSPLPKKQISDSFLLF